MSECSKSLAEILRNAAQPGSPQKIGIEIERIGIWPDCTPFRYEDSTTRAGRHHPGARTLLQELSKTYGWKTKDTPEGQPIGLTLEEGNGNITLEPGSQLELATIAGEKMDLLVERTNKFESQVDAVTEPWGLRWIGLGVNPCNTVVEVDVIPAKRYGLMTDYLGKRGQLATSMMRLTSSVQINLDYQSESEAIEMLQAALAAAPVSYALFANSPIFRGKPTQYLAYRRAIWERTDNDRTGLFHEAFEPDFNFDRYCEIATNRPLMFVQHDDGQFVPSSGLSLDEIEKGQLPGVSANEFNMKSTLQQLFPEARIKAGYVEVRSLDGLRPQERYAAAAFWMGLLYCPNARKIAIERLGRLEPSTKEKLLDQTAQKGMKAQVENIDLLEICRELTECARKGLEERKFGEERYLDPIDVILETQKTPAENLLEIFHSVENRKVQTMIEHLASSGKVSG